jgi:hypothetical protein
MFIFKANFETIFFTLWAQGLKPGGFKLWVSTGFVNVYSPTRTGGSRAEAQALALGFTRQLCAVEGDRGRLRLAGSAALRPRAVKVSKQNRLRVGVTPGLVRLVTWTYVIGRESGAGARDWTRDWKNVIKNQPRL